MRNIIKVYLTNLPETEINPYYLNFFIVLGSLIFKRNASKLQQVKPDF